MVILTGGGAGVLMVTLKEAVAVCGVDSESTAWTVTLLTPAAVGVPEMTPAVLNERPVGRLPPPDGIVQVYGAVPPEAVSVAL